MPNSVRIQREASILDAALAEMVIRGTHNITMQDIAQRCELTRSAIYQYFSSVEHILAELVINEMADLVNAIDQHLVGVTDPLEQVRIWVHYSLAHLATGEHAILRQVSAQTLPESKRGVIRALHQNFMHALVQPVSQLGIEHPKEYCHYISAVVNTAANRIDSGASFPQEAHAVENFVMSCLNRR